MKSAFIIILTIFLNTLNINAQEKIELNEKYHLIIDRPCYIAGEEINFKASPNLLNNPTFNSETLYLNLVNEKGESIEQKKVLITSKGSNGTITIPENSNSGYFRLYGYTKWQRNFGVECFAFKNLFVLNTDEGYNQKSGGSTVNLKLNNEVNNQETEDFNLIENGRNINIYKLNINTDKPDYGKREEININVSQPNTDIPNNIEFSMSVYKMPSTNDSLNYYPDFMTKALSNVGSSNKKTYINKDELVYFPETNGCYLTGSVINKDGNNNNRKFNLLVTSFDSVRTLKTIWTDNTGKFLINFESSENSNEVLIQINENPAKNYQIKVDNDFQTNFPELKPNSITLNDNDISYLKRLMLNYQINREYTIIKEEQLQKKELKNLFYGTHDTSYYLKKYIDLPTMEEVFNNITIGVNAKKKRNKFNMVVLDKNNNELLFPALILVDGIPVTDVQKMIKIHPSSVEKIAIINSNYMVGNTFFGGIISIFTKKNDFASIKLPKSAKIFNYKTVEYQNSFSKREIDIKTIEKNIPVFNNTIKWLPNGSLDLNGRKKIVFNSSDEKGKFLIKIDGYSSNGTLFSGETSYEIK